MILWKIIVRLNSMSGKCYVSGGYAHVLGWEWIVLKQ